MFNFPPTRFSELVTLVLIAPVPGGHYLLLPFSMSDHLYIY